MAAAREPMPAARVLDHKLANWSGGRRYTCPSYEIVRVADGVRIAVPGFQPFAVYDVIAANLVPGLDRREPPDVGRGGAAWTGTPLATKEVAVVCDIACRTRASSSAAWPSSSTSAPTGSGRSCEPFVAVVNVDAAPTERSRRELLSRAVRPGCAASAAHLAVCAVRCVPYTAERGRASARGKCRFRATR